jgi:hypothetical protein
VYGAIGPGVVGGLLDFLQFPVDPLRFHRQVHHEVLGAPEFRQHVQAGTEGGGAHKVLSLPEPPVFRGHRGHALPDRTFRVEAQFPVVVGGKIGMPVPDRLLPRFGGGSQNFRQRNGPVVHVGEGDDVQGIALAVEQPPLMLGEGFGGIAAPDRVESSSTGGIASSRGVCDGTPFPQRETTSPSPFHQAS